MLKPLPTRSPAPINLVLAVFGLLVSAADSAPPAMPGRSGVVAFPGAEGYGATASGGRGGTVYHVTTLADSGPGSFRDAVSQPHRTVVFDVGGIIQLKSGVNVNSNITIAGQTAPGQGISTSGDTVHLNSGGSPAQVVGNSNIIIRHMRFRQGYQEHGHGWSLSLAPAHHVILDHCSIEIGNWQTMHISLNTVTGERPSDITVQYCIIGASLSNQLGCLEWKPVNVTWHHNLFIDNGGRDPKLDGNVQVINDIVYNTGGLGIYGSGRESVDFIGNYHINGPANASSPAININNRGPTNDYKGTYYQAGNFWDKNRDGVLHGVPLVPGGAFNPKLSPVPLCKPSVPVTPDSAQTAYYKVVSDAGVSLDRDPLDEILIRQAASLGKEGPGRDLYRKHPTPFKDPVTGEPVPAWSIRGGEAPKDTDGDGMPDDWEQAVRSNPREANNNDPGTGGYTLLENYLNWMAGPHIRMTADEAATVDLSRYTAAFNRQSPVFAVANAVHGVVTLTRDGHTVRFVPQRGFTGLGSFDFKVAAKDGLSISRTVGVLVSARK